MTTRLYLTDEPSDLAGYRRLKLGSRSDTCSLVRSVTNTAAGPSSGIQITRTAGGTALAWISDPLTAITLAAAAWTFNVWAQESNAAANAALHFQILRWTVAEQAATLDDNNGTELTTASADYARTSGNATLTTMALGDRIVLKVLVDDAGTLVTGHTVTVSYNGEWERAEGDSSILCPDNLALAAGTPAATLAAVRRVLVEAAPGVLWADEDIEQAITAALVQYSRDRPLLRAHAYSGDGSTYDFPLPPGWLPGLSAVRAIEHPAGEQKPVYLDADDYTVHESVLGTQPVRVLRFPLTTPASGTNNIVILYTGARTHSDERDTVLVDDRPALWALSASEAALMQAARTARNTNSTIGADVVDHRTESDVWRSVAKALRERYEGLMGKGGPVTPAAAMADWDTLASWGPNRDRLVHGRRTR